MKIKSIAFTINTLEQAERLILESKIYKTTPTLHLNNYILKGFGKEYVFRLKEILEKKLGRSSFKLFVDCGFNSSASISMATKKIHYIKLTANPLILSKIKNIAYKNKVSLNPPFTIVDCRKIKNISLMLKRIYFKGKK